MPSESSARWPECNCLALRQAARHVSQFYDQYLASTGLRTTQFSILAKLKGLGPMTINALARELVMDRTTLGRTMLPLERDGLIAIKDAILDRRSKELAVTKAGTERLQRANCGSRRRRNLRSGSAPDARPICAAFWAKSFRASSKRPPQGPPGNASRLGRGSKGAISRGKD